MDEKRQLPLWAAVAGKDMEFAATYLTRHIFSDKRIYILWG